MSSISQSVGQHFIVGLSGPALTADDRQLLRELRPAGVILRAHNFLAERPYDVWIEALRNLLEGVKTSVGRANPIVAIDHEGGRVHRTPEPITHFPAPFFYSDFARDVAHAMAVELRSLGVNLSFAPVADIHSNSSNPVIGQRAFGSDPGTVARAAVDFAEALLAGGIVPVGKHFPGHGDTAQDSHEELPYLDLTIDQLSARELIPFRALVHAHVPCLLTAHIMFSKIDRDLPATLSPHFVKDILRNQLHYEGVVISDDLDMKAIALHFSDEQIAATSFEAGLDLLLFNHDPLRALRVAGIIEVNLANRSLLRDIFDKSSERVHTLFEMLPWNSPGLLSEQELLRHAMLVRQIAGEG